MADLSVPTPQKDDGLHDDSVTQEFDLRCTSNYIICDIITALFCVFYVNFVVFGHNGTRTLLGSIIVPMVPISLVI